MRTEWDQQIRKREGQHHFYRSLWKLLGSYLTCGLRRPLVLAIPSRAFSPVLLSPKHSQGKGTESHPTALQCSLTPLLPTVVLLISLLLLQSQPHQRLLSLGPSLCITPVTNARNKAQALTLHAITLLSQCLQIPSSHLQPGQMHLLTGQWNWCLHQ